MFDNNEPTNQAATDATAPAITPAAASTDTPVVAADTTMSSAPAADTTLPAPAVPEISSFNATPLAAPADEPKAEDSASVKPEPPSDLLTAPSDTDDLLKIKQEALQSLSPLIGQLDQSPEEQFRTTMMMIQASDDQSMVKSAYEAAQKITDEKAKAQALLDIVNEINYFTQNPAK